MLRRLLLCLACLLPLTGAAEPLAPKVMVLAMFGPEGQVWLDRLGPWRSLRVAGLPDDHPEVNCNADAVCVATLGMGHANAAASAMALVLAPELDLSRTYFLIAGIAGISPEHGTLGSVAWTHFLVDFGLQWEIDSREIPRDWSGGYLAINGKHPLSRPQFEYRTETFELNTSLMKRAFELSSRVVLADSDKARAWRARYRQAVARLPPAVIQCDTLSGDTWISGRRLAGRADEWTRLATGGRGVYCTTQQEDNATFEALRRGAALQRVDVARVAVLRAGSDFDRPPPGMSAAHNLVNYQDQGAFGIALENLWRAGRPLVTAIVGDWPAWREGVPER
jgi:purine nucleoside permease